MSVEVVFLGLFVLCAGWAVIADVVDTLREGDE